MGARCGVNVGLIWSMLDRCRVNVGSMWDRHGGGKIKIKNKIGTIN